jgi:hypothetical protein
MKNKRYYKEMAESEQKSLKDSRELYALHMEIHELLEKLVIKTNLGSIEESYADEINFDAYRKSSKIIFQTIPIKVHDVLQTEEDLIENIKKKDLTVVNIIRTDMII